MEVNVTMLADNYKSASNLVQKVEANLNAVDAVKERYNALKKKLVLEAEARKAGGADGSILLDQTAATQVLHLYNELAHVLSGGDTTIVELLQRVDTLLQMRASMDDKDVEMADDDKDYMEDDDDEEYEMEEDDEEEDFLASSVESVNARGRPKKQRRTRRSAEPSPGNRGSRSSSAARPAKRRADYTTNLESSIAEFFSQPTSAQANMPVPVGCQVAACTYPNREPDMWILATVIGYNPGKELYEVQDVDQGDEMVISESADDAGGKKFTMARSQIIPLPPDNMNIKRKRHEFVKGTTVLAMFPQTTCFYHATIAGGGPKSQRKSNDYLVHFVDDEDETGATPARAVPPRYVLSLP